LIASLALKTPVEYLTFLFSDDAYYYLLTAHNIANGIGSTFDGNNLTNGYHPLWMLSLLPIYFFTDNLNTALKLVILLQLLLAAFSIYFTFSLHKYKYGNNSAILSVILLLTFFSPFALMFNGLESGLLIFWITLSFYIIERHNLLSPTASLRQRLLLGFLIAGITTTRLDSVFIITALAILLLFWPDERKKYSYLYLIRFYLPTGMLFLLLISPYFFWNYFTFSHLMPISGSIKSTFPNIYTTHFGFSSLFYIVPFTIVSIYILFMYLSNTIRDIKQYNEKSASSGEEIFATALAVGCFIHLIWTKLYMSFGVYQWHFVAYIPIIIYYTNLILHRSNTLQRYISRKAPTNPFIVGSILGALICNSLIIFDKGAHHAYRLHAAKWLDDHTEKSESIALSDAGVFAYFNNRKTINLDGLINSYEFQQNIKDGKLDTIIEDNNIKYIANAYGNCDNKTNEIYLLAWRGNNLRAPTGYRFSAQTDDAVYSSRPILNRPISIRNIICFKIWSINDIKISRIGS
jgi:hypothetical protein